MGTAIEIVIYGDTQSKKNRYKSTRAGKWYKPQGVKEAEDQALMQIPSEFYGMNLEHPGVVFTCEVPRKSMALDMDGLFTTVVDYLVKAKVITDDNIRKFNGPKLFIPAEIAEHKAMKVWLYPDGKIPREVAEKWLQ